MEITRIDTRCVKNMPDTFEQVQVKREMTLPLSTKHPLHDIWVSLLESGFYGNVSATKGDDE